MVGTPAPASRTIENWGVHEEAGDDGVVGLVLVRLRRVLSDLAARRWRWSGWSPLPFDPSRYWTGFLFRKITVVHQRLNPLWTFRISGTLPENPRNPYVIVSNHESFVDILLISHLPWEMKWLSKKEMFTIPVAGWLMRLAKRHRAGPRGPAAAPRRPWPECRSRLDDGVSVMVFPEGTRSDTGDLLPFKDGAFRLAIEASVPILPARGPRCRPGDAATRLALRPLHRRGAGAGADQHRGPHAGRLSVSSATTPAPGSSTRSNRWAETSMLRQGDRVARSRTHLDGGPPSGWFRPGLRRGRGVARRRRRCRAQRQRVQPGLAAAASSRSRGVLNLPGLSPVLSA